jgi:hypothetical protein
MKQFRDTNYYVDKNGEIFRFIPERTRSYIRKQHSNPNRTFTQTITSPSRYRQLKPSIHNAGYKQVSIYFGDGKKSVQKYLVHKIVAECYLGPCPEGYEIDHIDCNKHNNHPSNLQYCTKEYNVLKGNDSTYPLF